jgi:hypothetical protein
MEGKRGKIRYCQKLVNTEENRGKKSEFQQDIHKVVTN